MRAQVLARRRYCIVLRIIPPPFLFEHDFDFGGGSGDGGGNLIAILKQNDFPVDHNSVELFIRMAPLHIYKTAYH